MYNATYFNLRTRPVVLWLGFLLMALGCAHCHAEGLTIHWKDRFLEVRGEAIPGGPIRTHYLEAYKRIELLDTLADGVTVRHVIEAGDDDVSFTLTAHNPTQQASLAHWAQPCMRVDTFTGTTAKDAREVYPSYIRKCFLMLDGKLTRLPTKPWATEARYVPGQVYAAPDVNRDDVNPRPLSKLVPSASLCGCFSADEKQILAVAWEPYQEIFQGVIACMHNDFRIGGLAADETKTIRGKLYVVPNNTEALLARFKKDFPAD